MRLGGASAAKVKFKRLPRSQVLRAPGTDRDPMIAYELTIDAGVVKATGQGVPNGLVIDLSLGLHV